MIGTQLDTFFDTFKHLLVLSVIVNTILAITPSIIMLKKGNAVRAVELFGNMLIGFLAMASFFFFPMGVAIYWGAYKEALFSVEGQATASSE